MSEWIKSFEKKPDPERFVLCMTKNYGICAGYRWMEYDDTDGYPEEWAWVLCPLKKDPDGEWWAAVDGASKQYPGDEEVTHWTPLPEPPSPIV